MSSSIGRDFPGLQVLDGTLTDGVRFAVSTREAGASSGVFARGNLADHVGDAPEAVAHNRSALRRALGAQSGLAVIAAVHGATTAWVREPGTYAGVDALITDTPGVGLVALGADCAVVGVCARRADGTPVVGVAHCGWRGLTTDVLGALVEQVRRAAGRNLQAVLGPTICGSCYPVDETRIQEVLASCTPGVSRAAVRSSSTPGQYHLDIRAGVMERLAQLDVKIEFVYGCTAEDERWFSHRSSVQRGGPQAQTGRHALGVVIEDDSVERVSDD